MSATLSRKIRRVKIQRMITQEFGVQLRFVTPEQIEKEQKRIIKAWRDRRKQAKNAS